MAGDTIITVIGNLVADPELRFTPSGVAVASFTIASTPRTYNKDTNTWEDGESLFLKCNLWRQAAENLAESFTKGTRVIAQGKIKQRSYETKEGEKRTVVELDVEDIGASIKTATIKINRMTRAAGGEAKTSGGKDSTYAQTTPAPDRWATPSQEPPPF